MPGKNIPLPATHADFGEVVYPPGGTLGPRQQRFVQLVAVHEGEATVAFDDGKPLHIPAQGVGLLLPGRTETFAFAADQPTRHSWCHLGFNRSPAAMRRALSGLPSCLALTQTVDRLIATGLACQRSGGDPNGPVLPRLGEALLAAYTQRAPLNAPGEPARRAEAPPALRRAREVIERRFDQPLELDDLARAANVTPHHLTRLFRTHLGVTPMRWLWRLRIERGVELLRHSGLSVSEIAYRVGFQSPFHFSRRVKRATGLSPSELRRRAWGGGGD